MLRLARPDDGAALAAIYAPAVTDSAISFELEPPDAAEMTARVTSTLERLPWLVCEDRAGLVAGYAYATPYRARPAYQWSVEVSAYVAASARRAGIGRALYTSLFALLIVQQYRNAYAAISLPNDASVRMHEALGFTMIGVFRGVGYKHGEWHDVVWLERALASRTADPQPPRNLADVRDAPAFREALDAGTRLLRPEH